MTEICRQVGLGRITDCLGEEIVVPDLVWLYSIIPDLGWLSSIVISSICAAKKKKNIKKISKVDKYKIIVGIPKKI